VPKTKSPRAHQDILTLSPATRQFAMYIAMVVRNALEDFHVAHLNDDQMKELNPIIRNAIATALHADEHFAVSAVAQAYVGFAVHLIPDYWEEPVLLQDFVEVVRLLNKGTGNAES